jgi:hypothetical protein
MKLSVFRRSKMRTFAGLVGLLLIAMQLPAQVVLPTQPQPRPTLPAQATQGMPMNQGPTLSEQLGEIELEPPRNIERLPPLWPYYFAVAAVAFILLVAACIWLLRRNSRKKPTPVIPPDILARQSLEALLPLVEQAKAREFCYGASEIVRSYIESRFGLRAAHQTTREFLDKAAKDRRTLTEQDTRMLDEFLNYCDLAKFARQLFTPKELGSMYDSALKFIEHTQPSLMAMSDKPKPEGRT